VILIEWGTDEYAFHIPGSILIDTAHIVWCSSVHLSRRSTAAGTGACGTCEQCRVDSRNRRLKTDLFCVVKLVRQSALLAVLQMASCRCWCIDITIHNKTL